MESARILAGQMGQMLLYIAVGYLLARTRLLSQEGSRGLTNVLLYAVLPCAIVSALQQERSPERMIQVLLSILLAAVALGIAMLIAALFFRGRGVDNFGAAFSNAGFMGIPLVSALLGPEAVGFAAGMVALLNVLQWTYGQWLLTGDQKQMSLRACLTSPMVISFALGLALFFSGLRLPALVTRTLSAMSACNGPLAMIVLGALLGRGKLLALITDPHGWLCSAVRLLLIPAVTLLLFWLVPAKYQAIRMAVFLTACAPVGSNVAVYAQRAGLDASYASRTVCLSTLLSVVTMPLMILLAETLW